MKWFIALVFCFAMCWVGWTYVPGAMGTWGHLAGIPITGYLVLFIGAFVVIITAKR